MLDIDCVVSFFFVSDREILYYTQVRSYCRQTPIVTCRRMGVGYGNSIIGGSGGGGGGSYIACGRWGISYEGLGPVAKCHVRVDNHLSCIFFYDPSLLVTVGVGPAFLI